MKQHQKTSQTEKVQPKCNPKRAAHSKTSVAHWKQRVAIREGKHSYSVQIAHNGRRRLFSLDTADKETAAAKALKIYLGLITVGWRDTEEQHREQTGRPSSCATVGELIDVATRLSSARPESLRAYTEALRRITAGILDLPPARKFKPPQKSWRATVDATPLDRLTPAAFLAFKNKLLRTAKTPAERDSRVNSFNSLLRNSAALCSQKIRPFIAQEINLPQALWFEGVAKEKQPPLAYKSTIDAASILAAAGEELAGTKPEVFKALLLTLALGLRRSEADKLLWTQFDFEAGTLAIQDTEAKRLKSRDSAGVLGLDAELVETFQRFHRQRKGPFVLEVPPRSRGGSTRAGGYRCTPTFKALIDWLVKKGVPARRPIHTMRKEVGSLIATRDGIFAASRFLRHSDIGITSRIYADHKTPVQSGLGSLLKRPVKQ
jgi:integrase